MKAVITVLGCDCVGIIAGVSTLLAEEDINILDISQTILQNIFTMIMLVDTGASKKDFCDITKALDELGKTLGVTITIQREDIFNCMHRI